MEQNTLLRRNWIAFSLVCAACTLGARTVLACSTMPRNLARPHAAVIAEAKQIFWAEATGSQPIKHLEKAQKAVRYKL
jgi:hypothetical protein